MSIRKPAVAGQFYPAREEELDRIVRRDLEEASVEPAGDKVLAIVSPHAGYMYSGRTAGYAFARVKGGTPKRVILLGCSHRYQIQTASVCDSGSFEIPLGAFPIDEPFAREFARRIDSESTLPHLHEHALEVQLPFLWVALGRVPIVPVLFGGPAAKCHEEAGRVLAELSDENDLIVASTDLSHYLQDAVAHQIDKCTLDTLLARDCGAMCEGFSNGTCSMCGGSAVVAAMSYALAKDARSWSVLDYQTSAAASGEYDRVVGYAAISMERES